MMPFKHYISEQLLRRGNRLVSVFLNRNRRGVSIAQCVREKNDSIAGIIKPAAVKMEAEESNVGTELSGKLEKSQIKSILKIFSQKPEIRQLATSSGIQQAIQEEALMQFNKYCLTTPFLPADLHVTLSDIVQGARNVTDIFPYFLRHAKAMYPHLDCLDDLKKISDLRFPANWYPLARMKERRIIFHTGPTNSGKTYHALKSFMQAKSGVYCGPLKLLAAEVFKKTNEAGVPCDLVTGEGKLYAMDEEHLANHVSCSVEMVNVITDYEVAVIDEVQLVRDAFRGWAWTRALLGVNAKEVHLCGETATLDLVKKLCESMNEQLEIKHYDRLTTLEVQTTALRSLKNVQDGDCIVCFNKNDIFNVTRVLEKNGREVAVIYGSLPPGTKLAQAAKFNDPDHPCKVLVATNAIGMGLNLHIRRIVFYSMSQPIVNEKGEKEIDVISVSSALQIAGRAGRHGTQFDKGFVTTFKEEDLPILTELLKQKPEPVSTAGLRPTVDQIELYAYHLPNASLSHLVDIFITLCTVESLYFVCSMSDFKYLADMLENVPLNLHAKYTFCCAPIDRKMPFVCSMYLKFARQYSKNTPVKASWLYEQLGMPFQVPKNISDLIQLECVFDVLDLYLWLSYRFPDKFPDNAMVTELQKQVDNIIQKGLVSITALLQKSATPEQGETTDGEIDQLKYSLDKPYKQYTQTPKRTKGLSQKLISEGLLTPKMLKELQEEWTKKYQNQRHGGFIGGYRRTPSNKK